MGCGERARSPRIGVRCPRAGWGVFGCPEVLKVLRYRGFVKGRRNIKRKKEGAR